MSARSSFRKSCRARARPSAACVLVLVASMLGACSGSATPARSGASRPDAPDASSATTATTIEISTRGSGVAAPVLSKPPAGRNGVPFGAASPGLLDRFDYVEEEVLLSGTATAYREAGSWGTDGHWPVVAAATAPYVTRLLVRRPAQPERFDGTAVVEWLNVSTGQDTDVEFAHAHDELLRHGTVWVGVSAQKVGVEGGGAAMAVPGVNASPLESWDPDRYGQLVHPGDEFSYDIFSQAAAAVRRPNGVDVLGGGHVRTVLAAGESQSAARLVTYVNAVHPVAAIYDGFLVHSRSNGGSVLSSQTTERPPYAWIRDDLDVPVFQFETETDLFGLPFVEARQPDTDRIRTWEVAGTAHLDRGMVDYYAGRDRPAGTTAPDDAVARACGRVNEGPQSAVLSQAVEHLRAWVVQGVPPPAGAPIQTANGAVARDERGIALGGVRTPDVDAPVKVLRGDTPIDRGYICSLFGSTAPLDATTLATLYPTHADYVAAVERSARDAVGRGHLGEADAQALIEAARASTSP